MKARSSPWFSLTCSDEKAHRNHLFLLYENQESDFNRRLFIIVRNEGKRVFKEAKPLFAERMRYRIASPKFGSRNYLQLCKSVNNMKYSVLPLFNRFQVLTSADKAERFSRRFSSNSTLIWSTSTSF